ncbi:MAG: transporter substrate-binding domain-containing protein, partial [Spirochaetota bacterium]
MFKKGILFILIFSIFSFFIFSGCSKDKDTGKKLAIATDATWPPMEFVNKDKEIVGFNIDMMKAIAKEGGFEVEFRNTAWDGIFAGLAANKYDAVISSVTITEERQKNMDFSNPYVNAGQVIVVKKELEGLNKLSQFAGKSAGAQIGTTGAIEIAKHKDIKLRSYDEIGFAIEDLANGRVDAVVCDSPIAA